MNPPAHSEESKKKEKKQKNQSGEDVRAHLGPNLTEYQIIRGDLIDC